MPIFRFDVFELDTERAWLGVQGAEVRLRAKAHHLLVALLGESPALQSTEQLLDKVWGTRHLTRNTVAQTIQEIRQALKPWQSRELIENVPRQGYRLTVPVLRLDASMPEASEPWSAPPPKSAPSTNPAPADEPQVVSTPMPPIPVPPTARLQWPRWVVVAVVVLAALSGLALLWQPFGNHAPARLPSVANLGVKVTGRGGQAVETTLATLISGIMVRDYGMAPIQLGTPDRDNSATSRDRSRRDAHTAGVDLWFDGALNLSDDGQHLAGQIWFGGGRDTSIQALMVNHQSLRDLPALGEQLAAALGRVAVWPKQEPQSAPRLSDLELSRLTEAQVLLAQGRPVSARDALQVLSDTARAHPRVLATTARAALLQGRRRDVLQLLPEPLDDPELRYLHALARGDAAAAVTVAQTRLQSEPPSLMLHRDLVDALLEAQQSEAALTELDRLEQLQMSDWDRAELTVLRVRVLNARGRHQDATRFIAPVIQRLQAVGDHELLLRARYQRALAASMQGDLTTALRDYLDLIDAARRLVLPRLEVRAVFGAADLLKVQGDLASAEALLTEAVQRFPEADFRDLMPQLQLGRAYLDMDRGQWQAADDKAMAAQEALDQYAPQDAAAWSLRAEIAMLQGDLTRSRDLLQKAYALEESVGANVQMARDAQRLAFRDLLLGDLQAARGQMGIADAHCRKAGRPQACQPAIGIVARTFDPARPSVASEVRMLTNQRRGLRELSQVLLALFWQQRDDEAALVLDLALSSFETAPRQQQEPFRLIAMRVLREQQRPLPAGWEDRSAIHPDMQPAWQVLMANTEDYRTACASPDLLRGWHTLVCAPR
ncbi:winged helix-turn-helix domain-containing protein [Ahniella affigens]|uniref:winged helix-turn-helix domain-containing protein n=1 Tax=Ahniella affigens TaxID=2021234 RepID=UPI0014728785|nr:winged helix-turn-helix domain-containing protein [Ahniella affigens]